MQCGLLLLRRQPVKIHSRQFSGVRRILQEELAGVFVRLNAGVNRLPEKRADFPDVGSHWMQSGMFLHDPALRIDHKGSGQRRNAAVRGNNLWRGHDNRIVDSTLLRKFQYIRRTAIVFGNADDLQTTAILLLQRDEFWNLLAARRAARGPEIHEDNFPAPVRQGQRRARNIVFRQWRGYFRVLYEANNRSVSVRRRMSRLRRGFSS